ncbi:hypothetical protein DU19_0222 [Chlamydia muridarum]|nr:hypothetical protein DU17_0222 [Chlamydia muridarum]KDU81193.1 hypothetical protein DU18_0223 [Chlamydia muridarum]KDU82008.1 hypothetical protein DU19_0222 [Chlamydia muridarum]KDU83145.1 hypothetical protein DU20_0222 [Chlamydia muridarum]KDU84040.1 hypothetical protein DU21_0222 [Chlamydia muridarum]
MRNKNLLTIIAHRTRACFLCMVTSADVLSSIAMTITWYCHS